MVRGVSGVSRVLAASEPRKTPRGTNSHVDCADVVAGLWITLGKLWLKGRRYGKVLGLMADTREKLNDPRLRDHPKRPAAEARMEGWRLELRDLEARAEPYRRGVARQWDGTPERIHRFLRDSGGWPEEPVEGKRMADALWRYAVEGKPYPGGECNFALLVGFGLAIALGGMS